MRLALLGLGLFALSCVAAAETVTLKPDMDELKIQEALISADPGTVFQFEAGTYPLTLGLSISLDNVTMRGRGMDKTILSFKKQEAGGQGIYITGQNVTLEDFTIQDTTGNAHKSNAANNHIIRRVKAEWTGGPKATNGAYGFYPVSSKNVLIEDCVAIGASDAGIYVGQTEGVIVRKSRAEFNVAGIEIENCHGADVYDNTSTNNTGGILVFDLPGLPLQKGHDVRVFHNHIIKNNTANFAPAGNIVANVSNGTGMMVMANSNVEVFENEIRDNQTFSMIICSYKGLGTPITDLNYYPYPEKIYVHDNTFAHGGYQPAGRFGPVIGAATGMPVPDILWDGFINKDKVVKGELPPNAGIVIAGNKNEGGEITFANLNAERYLKNPITADITRNIEAHKGEIVHLKPVVFPERG